jgi:hypothetical protein
VTGLAPRNTRLVRVALEKIGRALCRHAFVLVQQRDRLFLRCDACGAESPGISVTPAARGYTVQSTARRSLP